MVYDNIMCVRLPLGLDRPLRSRRISRPSYTRPVLVAWSLQRVSCGNDVNMAHMSAYAREAYWPSYTKSILMLCPIDGIKPT